MPGDNEPLDLVALEERQGFPLTRWQRGIPHRDAVERLLGGLWRICEDRGGMMSTTAWHWFPECGRSAVCSHDIKILCNAGECASICGGCREHVDGFIEEEFRRHVSMDYEEEWRRRHREQSKAE